MSMNVRVDDMLDYSDHERRKWHEWLAADPARLGIAMQTGGRFPTANALLEHVFFVERRHLARLEGATPPEATGIPPGDLDAMFEYADLVRANFRKVPVRSRRQQRRRDDGPQPPERQLHDAAAQAGRAHRAARGASFRPAGACRTDGRPPAAGRARLLLFPGGVKTGVFVRHAGINGIDPGRLSRFELYVQKHSIEALGGSVESTDSSVSAQTIRSQSTRSSCCCLEVVLKSEFL